MKRNAISPCLNFNFAESIWKYNVLAIRVKWKQKLPAVQYGMELGEKIFMCLKEMEEKTQSFTAKGGSNFEKGEAHENLFAKFIDLH